MNNFTFFWGQESPFSNWHPSNFMHYDYEFFNGEQAMMWRKAILFGDNYIAERILSETSPKACKALGRRVSNFDQGVWEEHRERIAYEFLYDKFTQNDLLLQELLNTQGTILVEASPYDAVWGIKLSASHPWAYDHTKWQGLNLLGKTLTTLRDDLLGLQHFERNAI